MQDLGDLSLELLKEDERPPWSAAQTVNILISHSSTYWKILPRTLDPVTRSLHRYLTGRASGRSGTPDVHTLASAASSLLDVLAAFLSNGDKAEASALRRGIERGVGGAL